jgi:hypothetical protein
VRQNDSFNDLVGGRLVTLAIFVLLAATFFSYQDSSAIRVVEAQARRQSRKTLPKRETQTRALLLASSFKHEHHRLPTTKLNCSDCHSIPTEAAPDVIAAATKLSIKGYPYHDSCLECHRRTPPQFFRGAAPSICTVCHTRSSARLTRRDVNPFPKRSEETIAREFPGYFPHGQRDHKRVNCGTCHMTDERAYVTIPVEGSELSFKPSAGTFKTSPSGHASCFKCHWEDEKPTKDDCAGCHLPPIQVAKKPRNVFSAHALESFSRWTREWPKRIALKFNHQSKDHDDECMTCHDITKIETLDILKAEVPIAPCAKCHLKPTTPASIGKEMFDEDEDIAEGRNNDPTSKEGKHTCTGCHSTVIGSLPPPCSHYLLFEDTYLSIEDYPKSAKQISERCKK